MRVRRAGAAVLATGLAAAGLGVASTGTAGADPVAPIYLVASSVPAPAGDLTVKARLEATGRPVVVVDDDAVATTDMSGGAMVALSSSVVFSKVGNKLADLPVPMLTWEAYLFDDNKLATTVGETSTVYRTIRVLDSAAAGGLTGTPTVTTAASKLSYGTVPASATKIAQVPGAPAKAVVFTYAHSALRTDGSAAPSCRAGFFPDYLGASKLNANGRLLLDTLIAGLLACTPPVVDSDGDGLADGDEALNGCDPDLQDTDADGLDDNAEVNTHGTDCTDADSDDDNLDDGDEVITYSTDPNDPDSDDDNLYDGAEVTIYNTDPNDIDSDNDEVGDGDEILFSSTDPNDADSDDDGLRDGLEIKIHTNPRDADTDDDLLSDGEEVNNTGTNPKDPDTDGGGKNDFVELQNGTDPLDGTDDFSCGARAAECS